MTKLIIEGKSGGQTVVMKGGGIESNAGKFGSITGAKFDPQLVSLATGSTVAIAINTFCHFAWACALEDPNLRNDPCESPLGGFRIYQIPTAVRNLGNKSVIYFGETPDEMPLPESRNCATYLHGNLETNTNSGPQRPPEVVVRAVIVPDSQSKILNELRLGEERLHSAVYLDGKPHAHVYVMGDRLIVIPLVEELVLSPHPLLGDYPAFVEDIAIRAVHHIMHHKAAQLDEAKGLPIRIVVNADELWENPKYPGMGDDLILEFDRYDPVSRDWQKAPEILRQARGSLKLTRISIPLFFQCGKDKEELVREFKSRNVEFYQDSPWETSHQFGTVRGGTRFRDTWGETYNAGYIYVKKGRFDREIAGYAVYKSPARVDPMIPLEQQMI